MVRVYVSRDTAALGGSFRADGNIHYYVLLANPPYHKRFQALMRVAKQAGKGWNQTSAKQPVVWAPSLVQEGWAGVVSAIDSWGKQHVGWARCIDQNIAKVSRHVTNSFVVVLCQSV